MNRLRPRVYLAVSSDEIYPYNIDCPAVHGFRLSGDGCTPQTVTTCETLGEAVDAALHHLATHHPVEDQ